jgi:predicted Zn-dependent protease
MRKHLVFAFALTATPATALACLNAVEMDTNDAKRLVAKVEKHIENGEPGKALRLLDKDLEVSDAKVQSRIELLRAVAQSRTGFGTLALQTLRPMLAKDSDSPYLKARVAEALAHTKKGTAEALTMLSDLETRDLMPDAEGWAELASLRAQQGDGAGRDRAITRCKAVAKRPAVCEVKPATTPDATPPSSPSAKRDATPRG